MEVTVHLHTVLARQSAQGVQSRLQLSLETGARLLDLLSQLEIELDPENLLLVINGHWAEADQVLNEGDEIHLIPAISGG